MNKKELLEHINQLLWETKLDKENAKKPLDEMYCTGKLNGLLWAKNFILGLEESE